MEASVKLENIHGIKNLEFRLPDKQGVYLVTGKNGCGKTTLFTALYRIGYSDAFKNSWKSIKHPSDPTKSIDDLSTAKICYLHDSTKVVYSKGEKTRWVARPKTNALKVKPFQYMSVVYIKASDSRFFQQDSTNVTGKTPKKADSVIRDNLNKVFETHRFDNLYVRNANSSKGRRSRKNQLYVVKDGNEYSEISFSLGELIVLNILDEISKIGNYSLLLIDEIELALHPRAQIRLYEQLKAISDDKHLTVLISTHSPTLIHACRNNYYLEKLDDCTVEVIQNCSPSYVLKDLSLGLDVIPDALIIVEDEMAHIYLDLIYKRIRSDIPEINRANVKILEGGGFKNVVQLAEQMSKIKPYQRKHIKALLDKDAEKAIEDTLDNPDKSVLTKDLFNRNKDLIDYLDITPEEGVWEWLGKTDKFKRLIEFIGETSPSFSPEWGYDQIATEDQDCQNPRRTAKKRLESMVKKIRNECIEFRDERQVYECLFEAYFDDVANNTEALDHYKGIFGNILNS